MLELGRDLGIIILRCTIGTSVILPVSRGRVEGADECNAGKSLPTQRSSKPFAISLSSHHGEVEHQLSLHFEQ